MNSGMDGEEREKYIGREGSIGKKRGCMNMSG